MAVRHRCAECRKTFTPEPSARKTQRVCGERCRAARNRDLDQARPRRDLDDARADERAKTSESATTCRGRMSRASLGPPVPVINEGSGPVGGSGARPVTRHPSARSPQHSASIGSRFWRLESRRSGDVTRQPRSATCGDIECFRWESGGAFSPSPALRIPSARRASRASQ